MDNNVEAKAASTKRGSIFATAKGNRFARVMHRQQSFDSFGLMKFGKSIQGAIQDTLDSDDEL